LAIKFELVEAPGDKSPRLQVSAEEVDADFPLADLATAAIAGTAMTDDMAENRRVANVT
jgi:hypothetical protein